MNLLEKIYYGAEYRYQGLLGRIGKYVYPAPRVFDSLSTLQYIKETGASMCRLGDGEFDIIFGGGIGFQKPNAKLAEELRQVLMLNDEKCLVCIPDVFRKMDDYREPSRRFWEAYLGRNRKRIESVLSKDIQYGNTNVTRFQTGYKDIALVSSVIKNFKEIWNNKELVIIEGSKTRLGVGNDLFDNAKSIKRVLVPPTDAYERKQEITEWIEMNISKDLLCILACGPTATVIVPQLAAAGYQALDLGHIDIQYEYYLRGITTKVAIAGKWVNESNQTVVGDNTDLEYTNSIIYSFGMK